MGTEEDNVNEGDVVKRELAQSEISTIFKVEAKALHYLPTPVIYYIEQLVRCFIELIVADLMNHLWSEGLCLVRC